MKPPVYRRMFGYNLNLLHNLQLAEIGDTHVSFSTARSK